MIYLHFDLKNVENIRYSIVNMNLNVLYIPYYSEQEFKLELLEKLKDLGLEFPKKTSLKSICKVILEQKSYETFEEEIGKSSGSLSELEECQLQSHNYGKNLM